MKEILLKDFIKFIRKPYYPETISNKKWYFKIFDTIRLWALLYLITLFLGFILGIIIMSTGYNVEDHSIASLLQNESIFFIVFLAVIFAPITEELTFRSFLRFKLINVALWIGFFIILLLSLSIVQLPEWLFNLRRIEGLISYLLFVAITALISYPLLKKRITQNEALSFYQKNVGYMFYFSALIFGLIHITNYSNLGNLVLFTPILILPQLVAGFFLGYIRIKYGLVWSIIIHMIHNGVSLLPTVLLQFGSANLKDLLYGVNTVDILENLSQRDIILLAAMGLGALIFFLSIIGLSLNLGLEWILSKYKFKK